MQSHENLQIWQKAVDLSVAIYALTESFPSKETYGITSQIRRAAVSVPSNIAEGRRRGSDADFRQFLRVAYGSLAELETQLLISKRLSYCDVQLYEKVRVQIIEMGKMLHAMIKKLS
jgi:four helix bundle protein